VFPAPATGSLAELVSPEGDKTNVPPAGAGPAAPTAPAADPPTPRRRGERRLLLKGLLTAGMVAATVTVAIAFAGLRDLPAARSGNAGSAGTQSGSAGTGGGADVAAPVEVSRSAGARASTLPFRDTAATKPASLAVTVTKRDASGDSGRPAQSGGLISPAASSSSGAPQWPAPSASTGGSQANGTLSVTPDPVNLGRQSTGQITLAASGGSVSWSASTSSGRLGLSSNQGTLRAGQSVTVTVNVTRYNGNSGSGYVVVDWNPVTPVSAGEPDASPQTSQDVQVSWSATVTTSPSPSPSPSLSPSLSPSPSPPLSPSPSPSPSASGSGGTSPSEPDSSSPQYGSS